MIQMLFALNTRLRDRVDQVRVATMVLIQKDDKSRFGN
jgi:hypothetical protein